MSMEHIRQVYKFPVKRGMLVQVNYRGDDVPRYREGINGKIGRVVSAHSVGVEENDYDYLMVQLEGEKEGIPIHPYDLDYLCPKCKAAKWVYFEWEIQPTECWCDLM